jgi:hypothetical protein
VDIQADAKMGGGTNEDNGRIMGSGADLVSSVCRLLVFAGDGLGSSGIEENEVLHRHNLVIVKRENMNERTDRF